MTEIPQGFITPSSTNITIKPSPAIAQLAGRLVVVKPQEVREFENTNKDSKNFGKMEEKMLADVTFLDGDPISVVLDQFGQVTKQLDEPISRGVTMERKIMPGFFLRKQFRALIGNAGHPGTCGRLKRVKTKEGSMWILEDPTPEELKQAGKWWAWKQQQAPTAPSFAPQSATTPAPPVTPPAEVVPPAGPVDDPWAPGPQQSAQSAPAGSEAKPAWM